jgi:hypothetical protein
MSNPSFQGPEAYQEIKKPSMEFFFQPQSAGKIIDNGVKKDVAPTPNTDEVAPLSSPQVPSSATRKFLETQETRAPPLPTDSIHKRKVPASTKSPTFGSNTKRKKERPAGQPDITSFFFKMKE